MTRQQYVEINGTKHYLNDEGDLTNGVGNVLIRGWAIATLGLKVETEEPRFEDLDDGVYQLALRVAPMNILKTEGDWFKLDGEVKPLHMSYVNELPDAHAQGKLFRLERGEATNA